MAKSGRKFNVENPLDIECMEYLVSRLMEAVEKENESSVESTQIEESTIKNFYTFEEQLSMLEKKIFDAYSELDESQTMRRKRISCVDAENAPTLEKVELLENELFAICTKEVSSVDNASAASGRNKSDVLPKITPIAIKLKKLWIRQKEEIKRSTQKNASLRKRYEKNESRMVSLRSKVQDLFVCQKPTLRAIIEKNEKETQKYEELVKSIETCLDEFVKVYKDEVNEWLSKNISRADYMAEKIGATAGSTAKVIVPLMFA